MLERNVLLDILSLLTFFNVGYYIDLCLGELRSGLVDLGDEVTGDLGFSTVGNLLVGAA